MSPHADPSGGLDPHLLEPSLQRDTLVRPIWSANAGFWTAFVGGVYGGVFFGLANTVRMQRIKQDAWLYVLAAVSWTAALVWVTEQIRHGTPPVWLTFLGDAERTTRRGGQGLALLLFGGVYLRQRALYKAQALSGHAPPNAWPLGLGSVAAAALLTWVVSVLSKGLS